MAYTVTASGGEDGSNASATTVSTDGASTPTEGDVVVVFAGALDDSVTYTVDSISHSGGGTWTFTKRGESPIAGGRVRFAAFTAIAPSGVSSGEFTATYSDAVARRAIGVVYVPASELDTSSLYVANDIHDWETSATGTESATVSGYTAGNLVVAVCGGRGHAPIAPGTATTEVVEFQSSGGGNDNQAGIYYAETGTIEMTDLNTSNNRWGVIIALELQQAAGGASRRVFHIS